MRSDDEGVVLVQLLVVVALLAILAAIALVAVGTTTTTGPRRPAAAPAARAYASCRTTVASVESALQAYKAEEPTGTYPATLRMLAERTSVRTAGPWLRSAPSTTATPAGLSTHGWAITSYRSATGTFDVATAHGPARPTRTPTVCKGA
jgi:Tfp pilus assembly protein PilE